MSSINRLICLLALISGLNATITRYSPQWYATNLDQIIGKNIALISDIGTYLSVCPDCPGALYRDPIIAEESARNYPSTMAMWKVQYTAGKVAFKSAYNNKYLTRCEGCFSGGPTYDANAAFAHVYQIDYTNQWSLWSPFILGDRWLFVADNGNYLTRCQGCVSWSGYNQFVFTHVNSNNGRWCQWKIVVL